MSDVEFMSWPKIPRVGKSFVTVTEKIDGTNACIIIENGEVVGTQSRKRLIQVDDDNFGFAQWVEENKKELIKLGNGYHYGEWAGPGIQKNPHRLTEKTFFYFNTARPEDTLPDCVSQVPVLYHGTQTDMVLEDIMMELKQSAEAAEYKPEGVVVYHHTSNYMEKCTFEFSEGKWKGNQ